MAGKFEIDAIKMVRAIRDRHARLLAGKSEEETMAFYRKEAAKLMEPQPTVRKRRTVSKGRRALSTKSRLST